MIKSIRDFFKNNQTPFFVVILAVFLGLIAYQVWQNSGNHVPSEFNEARNRAGELALEITTLTNTSAGNLQKISAEDEAGHYKEALALVELEVSRNQEIRQKTNSLAAELSIMADNLGKVRPRKAGQIGKEALALDVEMVKRLLDYNTFNNDLLALLQERLQENGSPETRKAIEATILRINSEASRINDLNNRYHDLMGEFDRLTQ